MKRTPLYDNHVALGARMVDFAGFEMPVYYRNIRDEHMAVRSNAGMFDVSHMGEFIVKGKEALDLVQSISSNDASKLNPGDAQYTCIPNDTGGIVDDMLVYRLSQDQCSEGEMAFMLVVNGANIQKDWNWILAKNTFDTRLIDISDKTGLLAVQGPKVVELLQSLTDTNLKDLSYYTFTKGTFAGIENVLISATGYTGSGGLELYVDSDKTIQLWEAILALDGNIQPVGLGARDTLRLEMGFCLYGNDIDDTTSPLEAGLGWITKLKKKSEFSSQNIIKAAKSKGLRNRLVGFKIDDRRVPRQNYPIFDMDMNPIGRVTSGTLSPSLEHPIGMGYVNTAYRKKGTILKIQMGKKIIEAEVCGLPFVQI
jgi:aminomethyltransferase